MHMRLFTKSVSFPFQTHRFKPLGISDGHLISRQPADLSFATGTGPHMHHYPRRAAKFSTQRSPIACMHAAHAQTHAQINGNEPHEKGSHRRPVRACVSVSVCSRACVRFHQAISSSNNRRASYRAYTHTHTSTHSHTCRS